MNKKIISIVLALCMIVSCAVVSSVSVTAASTSDNSVSASADSESVAASTGVMSTPQQGVILHAWDWSFNNIKSRMKQIADSGYTSVQTSVIQQSKEGTKGKTNNVWWLYYQPCNFTIDNTGNSALGTKAEFTAMCTEAHKYNIHVLVDVVANHLGNNTGYDKSSAIPSDIRNDNNCWHDQWNQEINYDSRYSITHGSMGGLPDLNTENSKIQTYVKNFLRECIDCGADGFRFDAAKHIGVPNDSSGCNSDFWPTVLGDANSYYNTKGYFKSSGGLYSYGEILSGTGGPSISQYTQYMSVTDNVTGNDIRGAVAGHNASGAAASNYKLGAGASKSVLWAESHDTYAGDGKESTGVSQSDINKTWALVGSRNQATALYFARTKGYRTGNIGDVDNTSCFNKEVVEVNKFHNYFNGQSEYLASSGSIAYNERGTSGVVLVNCNGSSQSVSVKANKMAAGTYVDQVTGNSFTVSGGQIKGQIGSTGIAVVYNKVEETQPTTQPVKKVLIGDADQNNRVSIKDATTIQLHLAEVITLTGDAKDAADANRDNTVTVKDVTSIQRYLAKFNDSGNKCGQYTDGTSPTDPTQPTDPVTYPTDPITYPTDPTTSSDVVVFSDNQGWGSVYCYAWGNGDTLGAWPGTQMSYYGTNEYGEKQYSITVPSGSTGIIFSNGSGAQTVDISFSGGGLGYYITGWSDGKANVDSWQLTDIPPVPVTQETSQDIPSGEILFSDNQGWGQVYCYGWGSGDTLGGWPGTKMQEVGTNDFGEKQFKISIPSGTANIIFSNGNGAQTVDIPYSGGVTGYYITGWSDGKATVGSW